MNRGWRTIVCVASGPSLTDADCELVHRAQVARLVRVIVVNDSWRKVPSADVLWACDAQWWRHHVEQVAANFHGELWTHRKARKPDRKPTEQDDTIVDLGLDSVEFRPGGGLCRDSGAIHGGSNGGYQAINLAYQFGARRIVLLGYDMQRTGNRAHFFGDHPPGFTQGEPSQWVKNFEPLARDLAAEGVDVWNATRATALECFPRVDLAGALIA